MYMLNMLSITQYYIRCQVPAQVQNNVALKRSDLTECRGSRWSAYAALVLLQDGDMPIRGNDCMPGAMKGLFQEAFALMQDAQTTCSCDYVQEAVEITSTFNEMQQMCSGQITSLSYGPQTIRRCDVIYSLWRVRSRTFCLAERENAVHKQMSLHAGVEEGSAHKPFALLDKL